MRVWELDDVRALPGDIVREQDFIMRLRHLHRQGGACSIINLNLGGDTILQDGLEKREAILRALAARLPPHQGQLFVMSQGDGFIIAPPADTIILREINTVLQEHGIAGATEQQAIINRYQLPDDYTAARERTNYYIEAARAAAQIGAANPTPELALQGEQVRGTLTPWALDQIVKLFGTIDVRRYVRHQTIYRHTPTGWQKASAEYFVSVEELRRERFPRLDIRKPERLFMELCSELDHRLLGQFADQPGSLAQGAINLNISLESVLGTPFARFNHALPPAQRQQMTFEINRGDLLLNFNTTQAAFALLKQEGYKIALDALSPALLPYLNCAQFEADFLKIRCGKDVLPQLNHPAVLQALQALPKERIIFYRCDDEAAITLGKALGISLFQGWHIDDVASHKA
jgi:EAL domain-containing protein (putative c-di-GMP-specific phosphodiesterase class I)